MLITWDPIARGGEEQLHNLKEAPTNNCKILAGNIGCHLCFDVLRKGCKLCHRDGSALARGEHLQHRYKCLCCFAVDLFLLIFTHGNLKLLEALQKCHVCCKMMRLLGHCVNLRQVHGCQGGVYICSTCSTLAQRSHCKITPQVPWIT